jgi:two-component system, sensor histidine kinase
VRWIAERGKAIFEGETPVQMNGTCIDITELKKVEQAAQRLSEELAAANEELRAANEEIQSSNEELSESNGQLSRINADLDNFVYTASHDLKAPILNMEGLLKRLERRLSKVIMEDEMINQIYQLLFASVARFKSTLADLTEVARITKETATDTATVSLQEVLAEVLQDLETQIIESEAVIETKLEYGLLHFSRKNLKSILYNLLSNAIKYRSPERKPFIQVTCRIMGDNTVLSVRDNGLGIDIRQQDKLFTLFKRLHTHVDGTGIGLYIVKKMIENAGGKIEVESEKGIGSTFSVYIRS